MKSESNGKTIPVIWENAEPMWGWHASHRIIGLDLFRILSMFLVVTGHIQLYGHILEGKTYSTIVLNSFCLPAVPMFVMLSGFLLSRKPFSFSRLAVLWLQVLILAKGFDFGGWILFRNASRLTAGSGYLWFWRTYLPLSLLMPLLNSGIIQTGKQKSAWLLVSVSVLFFLIPGAGVEHGKSIAGFILFYCTGAWLRLYGKKTNHPWLICLASVLLVFIAANGRYFFSNGITGKGINGNFWLGGTSPFVQLSSLLTLWAFASFRFSPLIHPIGSIIQYMSDAAFGVYIVTEHPFFKQWFFSFGFSTLREESPFVCISMTLVIATTVYFACSAVDYVRSIVFPSTRIRYIINRCELKIERIFHE